MPLRDIATAALAMAVSVAVAVVLGRPPLPVFAAGPGPSSAVPASPAPCPRSLKFAGSLYLDAEITVPHEQVGPQLGETEPNPARCALPDRLKVYRHNGHNSTDEVVYFVNPETAAVFRSAGQTGFPGAALVRWLVLALVLAIILFAAVPAILAHLRQPPVEVATGGSDWVDDA